MMNQAQETLSITRINQAIQLFEKNLKAGEIADHIVIFWGYSGTGKSSTIIILNGQEMIGYHHQDTKQNVVMNRNPSKNIDDVRIETQIKAGTKIPAVLPLQFPNSTLKTKKSVKLWDMPGFGDNRDITQVLINTYFIHRIFALHQNVKVAFTISYVDLNFSNKGSKLADTVKQLTTAFDSFPNYQKCMVLVITKAINIIDVDGVIKAITKIIQQLPFIKQNPKIYSFFQFVIKKKIPIVIVKQADLPNNQEVVKENPIFLDYSKTIKQFYTVVEEKLQHAHFPNLKGPAMSNKLKLECQEIVNKTKTTIQRQQNNFINGILPFVQKIVPKLQGNFDSPDVFNVLFKNINKLSEFTNKFFELSSFSQTISIGQLISKFNNLNKLVEEPEYQFLCQKDLTSTTKKMVCAPIIKISNQFIIVDFLATIQFKTIGSQFSWIDKTYCIKQFFTKIKNKQNQVYSKIQQKKDQLNNQAKKFMNKKFETSLKKIEESQTFKLWLQQMKLVPSFFMKTCKYYKAKQSYDYLNQYEEYQNVLNFDTSQVGQMKKLIQLFKINGANPPSFDNLIKQNILPFYQKTMTDVLKKAENFSDYTQPLVTNILQSYQGNKTNIVSPIGSDQKQSKVVSYKDQTSQVNKYKKLYEQEKKKNLDNKKSKQKDIQCDKCQIM